MVYVVVQLVEEFETDATKPDSLEIVTNKVQLWTIVRVGMQSDSEIEVRQGEVLREMSVVMRKAGRATPAKNAKLLTIIGGGKVSVT